MADGDNNQARRAQVERIVRLVLAEMAAASRNGAAASTRHTPGAGGELAIGTRVVSTRELEGQLDGVRRVLVQRGAVVTPAARDMLRERQVTIATAVDAGAQNKPKVQLVLAVTEMSEEPAALADALSDEGIAVERAAMMGLISVMDEVCQRVRNGQRLGLVLTGQPAAAACLANRQAGVRAAVACDTAAVAAAISTLGPNVLVVDPTGKSMFEWRQIVRTWLARGTPHCPQPLDQRLG